MEFVTLLVLLLAVSLLIFYVLVFQLWFLLRCYGFVSFGFFCKSSQESGQCVFSGFDGLAKATCLHSAGPVCFFDSGMAILILYFALFSFFQCIHFGKHASCRLTPFDTLFVLHDIFVFILPSHLIF